MATVSDHQMKFRVVVMTPAWAADLLKNNHPRNRRKKERRIESYARDMRQGYWKLTPEPVCVDVDGHLTNGQNRLSAVIVAGCEVPMVLVTGCPVDSITGQDMGATRNVADMACISGERLQHGATATPGVIRAMNAGLTQATLTNVEVLMFAKEHADALDFAFECLPKQIKGITQAAVRAVIARAYYKRNSRTRTREFCEVLVSGLPTRPKADSGAIRLRNYLVDLIGAGVGRKSSHRVKSYIIYAKCERALKAFHDEEPIEKLIEYKREMFPLPSERDRSEEPEPEVLLDTTGSNGRRF